MWASEIMEALQTNFALEELDLHGTGISGDDFLQIACRLQEQQEALEKIDKGQVQMNGRGLLCLDLSEFSNDDLNNPKQLIGFIKSLDDNKSLTHVRLVTNDKPEMETCLWIEYSIEYVLRGQPHFALDRSIRQLPKQRISISKK